MCLCSCRTAKGQGSSVDFPKNGRDSDGSQRGKPRPHSWNWYGCICGTWTRMIRQNGLQIQFRQSKSRDLLLHFYSSSSLSSGPTAVLILQIDKHSVIINLIARLHRTPRGTNMWQQKGNYSESTCNTKGDSHIFTVHMVITNTAHRTQIKAPTLHCACLCTSTCAWMEKEQPCLHMESR